MIEYQPKLITGGLKFAEGPRWHDGKLYLADMFAACVMSCTPDGDLSVEASVDWPSGLGFDPSGHLLISSIKAGKLLKRVGSDLALVADLSALGTPSPWGMRLNDLVVDGAGNAYAGIYGVNGDAEDTGIVLVRADGTAHVVADKIKSANGMAITPDGLTLIVAEYESDHLSAFTINDDNTLRDRRVWARVPGRTPDGICLDAEGAVWMGSAHTEEFLRIREGGEIVGRVSIPGKLTVAPALGGDDRCTLYMMTARASLEDLKASRSTAFVEAAEVDVPGAGWP